MFQNVRKQVSQETNSLQIPWESTSLVGDFYFVPKPPEEDSSNLESPATVVNSSGISTATIEGFEFTYRRFGKDKGIYMGDNRIKRKEFEGFLYEYKLDGFDLMRASNEMRWFGYSFAIGGLMMGGYGTYLYYSEGESKRTNATIWEITGGILAGSSVYFFLRASDKYKQAMRIYFTGDQSYLQFGPTRHGFGIALNF